MSPTDVIASIGSLATAIAVIYGAQQLAMTRKITQSQFMLDTYELLHHHDEAHHWLTIGKLSSVEAEPESAEDWNKIRRYIGFLENFDLLMSDGIIDAEAVDRSISHRVFSIVRNNSIRERCLMNEQNRWKHFFSLWRTLEKEGVVFQELSSNEK